MTGAELTWEAGAIAAAAGLLAAGIGGAIGGLATGAKALGNEIALMMGCFYGPIGGFTGVVIGLVLLFLIR